MGQEGILDYKKFQEIISSQKKSFPDLEALKISKMLSVITEKDFEVLPYSSTCPTRYYGTVEDKRVCIKIESMQYSCIKKCFKNYEKVNENLKGHCVKNLLINKLNFGLINDAWVLATITENFDHINLNDFIAYILQNSLKFPVEIIVYIVIELFACIKPLMELEIPLGPISLEDVVLVYTRSTLEGSFIPFKPFYNIFNSGYLREKSISNSLHPENSALSFQNFCLSVGELIYACLAKSTIHELPKFSSLGPTEIEKILNTLPNTLGLIEFTRYFLSESLDRLKLKKYLSEEEFSDLKELKKVLVQERSKEIVYYNIAITIKTWHRVFNLNSFSGDYSFISLVTPLYFDNKALIFNSIKILSSSLNILEDLNRECIEKGVHIKLILHLTELPELTKSIINFIMHFLLKLKALARSCVVKYSFPLIKRLLSSKIDLSEEENRKTLIKLLVCLMDDYTLSIQTLAYNELDLYSIFKLYPSDCGFLIPSISFIGIDAIDKIIDLKNSKFFSDPLMCIEFIHKIPIHIKLQKTFEILDQIEILFSNLVPTIGIDCKIHYFILAFCIVYETMQGGREAKESNRLGVCYKNSLEYNVTPVMISCTQCDNKLYCVPCGRWHADLGHKIFFMTNRKLKNFECQADKFSKYEPHPTQQIFPRYETLPISNCIEEDNYYVYKSDVINIVNNDKCDILYYTEIFIEYCYNENIYIEIEGSGIIFHNLTTVCKKNNSFVCNFPRIGINDTIGIGITSDCCIFFTYNGFNMNKYINFNSSQVRIVLKFDCEKPRLINPINSLYIGDGFNYLEKELLSRYQTILRKYFFSYRFRDTIFKKKNLNRQRSLEVMYKLRDLCPTNKFESILKQCGGSEGVINCSVY